MAEISSYIAAVTGPQSVLPYQRTYNWDVLMFFSMGGIRGELLSKFCQDVKFGDYSLQDLIQLRWGGKSEFFPGTMQLEAITFTFVIPTPDLVGMFFRAWRDKILSPQGFYGLKHDYMRNIYIWLDSTSYFPSSRYILKRAFPLTPPTFDLSYGTDDVLRYTITMSVDRVEIAGIVSEAVDFAKGLLKW